jgi:hypothetical protein
MPKKTQDDLYKYAATFNQMGEDLPADYHLDPTTRLKKDQITTGRLVNVVDHSGTLRFGVIHEITDINSGHGIKIYAFHDAGMVYFWTGATCLFPLTKKLPNRRLYSYMKATNNSLSRTDIFE